MFRDRGSVSAVVVVYVLDVVVVDTEKWWRRLGVLVLRLGRGGVW
jgi:hypothetical protein